MKNSKILVWDLPTRVFHWLLALSFALAYATADSERLRDVHVICGYTMLGLVAFRLLWGVIGTRYARFSSFTFGVHSVWAYVKSLFTPAPQHHVGHNPAGSWAIYALLAFTLLAGATGYATYNDFGGRLLGKAHEAVANAMLAVVLAHVIGALVSSVLHRENLVRAMVSGYKTGDPADGIRHHHRMVALVLLLAVMGYWITGPQSFAVPWNGKAQTAATHRDARHHGRD